MAFMIPPLADLPAKPNRIILHWTGGGPTANNEDKAAYHIIINRDGTAVAGHHAIAANMRKCGPASPYAQHTGGFNSFSIGVSFAGMGNCKRGRKFGPYPLTEQQVAAGLKVVADLCKAYGLTPDEDHVFTHYEAFALHNVKGTMNDQKWDITELEFLPDVAPAKVGDWLRAEVKRYMS